MRALYRHIHTYENKTLCHFLAQNLSYTFSQVIKKFNRKIIQYQEKYETYKVDGIQIHYILMRILLWLCLDICTDMCVYDFVAGWVYVSIFMCMREFV